MPQESALLEREPELAMLRGLVDRLATTGEGGTVLIEGVAGIGKSSLLQELVAVARGRGEMRVLTTRGTELELDLAFGAVRQLFAPVVSLPKDERDRLLAGPAALAAAVLGLHEAPSEETCAARSPERRLIWLRTAGVRAQRRSRSSH